MMKQVYACFLACVFFVSALLFGCAEEEVYVNPQGESPPKHVPHEVIDVALTDLFSGTGYIPDQNRPWQLTRDEFLQTIPHPELLDPENSAYNPLYVKETDTGVVLGVPYDLHFTDLAYTTHAISYGFSLDEKFAWVGYFFQIPQADLDAHVQLLKTAMQTVFDNNPKSLAGGRELVDDVDEIEWDTENMRVCWLSKKDDTFLRLETHVEQKYDIITFAIMVGLQSYYEPDFFQQPVWSNLVYLKPSV